MSDPPNQVLQFMLTLLDNAINDPASEVYLPRLIQGQSDPAYEPYTVTGNWHISDEPNLGYAAQQICLAYCPDPDSVGEPTGLPDLWLLDQQSADFAGAVPFQISGLSNMVIAHPTVTHGDTAVGTATVGTIATWPIRPLTVTGNWRLTQGCCAGDLQYTGNGYGTFTATIQAATIDGQVTVDGANEVVTVDSLTFAADATQSNMQVVVELLEITDPKIRKMWNAIASEAFNDPLTLAMLVSQIAAVIASPTTLASFGALATQAMRSFFGHNPQLLTRLRARA